MPAARGEVAVGLHADAEHDDVGRERLIRGDDRARRGRRRRSRNPAPRCRCADRCPCCGSHRPRSRPCRGRASTSVAAPLRRWSRSCRASSSPRPSRVRCSRPRRRLRAVVLGHVVVEVDAVVDRLDAVHAARVDAGQRRPHRRRAGRDHELVERLGAFGEALVVIDDGDRARCPGRWRALRDSGERRCRCARCSSGERATNFSTSPISPAT